MSSLAIPNASDDTTKVVGISQRPGPIVASVSSTTTSTSAAYKNDEAYRVSGMSAGLANGATYTSRAAAVRVAVHGPSSRALPVAASASGSAARSV